MFVMTKKLRKRKRHNEPERTTLWVFNVNIQSKELGELHSLFCVFIAPMENKMLDMFLMVWGTVRSL